MTQESTSSGSPSAEPLLPPVAQAALLVAIAGFTDAVGFLRYQAFACQMTGNTLLLALSVFHQSWLQSLYYVPMIACFVLGVRGSSGLIRAGRSPVLSLCLAGALLALCSFIGLKWASPLLGFAMGHADGRGHGASARPASTRSTSPAICSACSKAWPRSSGRGAAHRPLRASARWRWSGWNISAGGWSGPSPISASATPC